MTYQTSLLAVLFIVNACVAAVFVFFGWSRRKNPGGMAFTLLIVAVGEWSLTAALEAAAVEIAGKIFWAKVEYLGIGTTGFLWLVFALAFTRRKEWLTAKRLILVGIIPAVTIGLAFTNELHNLIWTGITPNTTSPFHLLIYRHGAWFWVVAGYTYAAFTIGTILLLNAFRLYTKSYRFGIVLMVGGAVLPIIGNVLYVTGLSPLPGLDLTHFGFVGTALVFSMTIFRYKIFDLRPFARDLVVEGMSDGFVVLDEQSRIVDLNPAAIRLFTSPGFLALGLSAEEAAIQWSGLTSFLGAESGDLGEIGLGDRTYQMGAFVLWDGGDHPKGRVLTINDVTQSRAAEAAVKKSEERFRGLYEDAPYAYFFMGTDGAIQTCSRRAVELLGFPETELIGRRISDLCEDGHDGKEAAKTAMGDFTAGRPVIDRELRMRRADGTPAWIGLSINSVLGTGGETVEIRSIVVDITQRKKIEGEKEKLIAELQKALKEIKTLSGLLPICSVCKKIRDDKGYWKNLEEYLREHTGADFTHGICPECLRKQYPEYRK